MAIWLILRYFMRTQTNQGPAIGDLSPEFAISSFFPERARPTIEAVSDGAYAIANMCGLVTRSRRYLEGTYAAIDAQEELEEPKETGEE